MNFEQLIKNEIEKSIIEFQGFTPELIEKFYQMHSWFEFLLTIIIVQQKDACEATGITPETLRRKILEGHLTPFSRDGSRLNFVSVKQMIDLKPRIRGKRKAYKRKGCV